MTEGGYVFHCLRQQADRGEGEPNKSIADLVAPIESGVADHVGAFAVSTGFGADELAKAYEAEHDDYRAIVVKALADRLAEAFAEYLHEQVRREWYAPDERFSNEDLIEERYQGTRPAFGYPPSRIHSEKRTLFELLDASTATGIDLTTSCAMMPAASVSGLYLAHPAARYFHVGRIARDQVEDYARRKGESLTEAERWLAANLAYEPASRSDRGSPRSASLLVACPAVTQTFWHPFADMASIVTGGELVLERGEGCYVWDVEGNRYLDATASLWYCNVGWGRGEIGEAAAAQMATLPAYSAFGDFVTPVTLELADRVAGLAPFDDAKVFLTSGGSDSIDTATKMARRYWQLLDEPDRTVLIRREKAYHGMHTAGTSLAGIPRTPRATAS